MKINTAERCLKRLIITNAYTRTGVQPTPCLMGDKGIGKTQVCSAVAKDLGTDFDEIQGSLLQDGEMAGYPLAVRNNNEFKTKQDNLVHYDYDGYGEVKMIPHPSVRKIQVKENRMFRMAFSTAFGKSVLATIGIDVDGLCDDSYSSREEKLRSLLNQLTGENKEKLMFGTFDDNGVKVSNGKRFIVPTILSIDEINRCQQSVKNELMNFLLSRDSNGYILPFWVLLCATANPPGSKSGYSVGEFDSAQLSRLAIFNLDVDVPGWIEYAVSHDIDNTVIDFVADNGLRALIGASDTGSSDSVSDGTPTPSPRSWEMVSNGLKHLSFINAEHFPSLDPATADNETSLMVSSLVGPSVGTSFNAYRKENAKRVNPKDVLTGTSKTVSPDAMLDINSFTSLRAGVVIDRIYDYLVNSLNSMYSEGLKTQEVIEREGHTVSGDPMHTRAKNMCLQLCDLIHNLSSEEIKYMTAAKSVKVYITIPNRSDRRSLYLLFSDAHFNSEVSKNFSEKIAYIISDMTSANEVMRVKKR